jgi:phosphinothricin acetyltransferase
MKPVTRTVNGKIRFATLADARRIAEIYNHAIAARRSTCDLEKQPDAVIEAWFDGRDFGTRPIYVHVLDGVITGYLLVADFLNGRPGYRVTADCGLYLDPAFQGRGIGSALLAHFLEKAPTLGVATVTTSMFADNVASVRLFEKFGFVRVGLCRRVANLDGNWKDVAIVQRSVAR